MKHYKNISPSRDLNNSGVQQADRADLGCGGEDLKPAAPPPPSLLKAAPAAPADKTGILYSCHIVKKMMCVLAWQQLICTHHSLGSFSHSS